MNIQIENQPNGTAYVTATVEPVDYQEEVKKELKNLRRSANIPGFRPGMVPFQLIEKKYGKSVLAEKSYRISYDAVANYLKDNNISTVGDIIPSEKQGQLDFDNSTSFDYCYKIGIAPEIKISLTKKDKIEKPVIVPTDDMVSNYKDSYLKRFATFQDVDTVESDETLTVILDNGDIKIEEAHLSLVSLNDEKRTEYKGKKVGDKLTVKIDEVYPSKSQRASVLEVKEDELDNIKNDFTLEIKEIKRLVNPELNDEFFEKAFPKKDVTNEQQFTQKMQDELKASYEMSAQPYFWDSVIEFLDKKANASLPDDFLKEWLFLINEGKFSREDIEKEYKYISRSIMSDLISKSILKENNITVGKDQMIAEAKSAIRMQFMNYGINDIDDDTLSNYAEDYLKNDKEGKLVNSAVTRTVVEFVSGKITVSEKEMTVDEFTEYMKAKNSDEKETKPKKAARTKKTKTEEPKAEEAKAEK